LLGLLLSLPLLAAPGVQEVPRNDGWVTDLADLLTEAQEAELEDLMESYQEGSGHEIALLTVTSLAGRPIEELALETARAWGVSGRKLNDGALLVVAKDDRRMRFEVGQGLEGMLTDAVCSRIIRDVMAPAFREGRYYEGMREGLLSAHEVVGGDYARLERAERLPPQGASALCPLLVVLLFVFLALAGRRRRGAGAGGVGGAGGAAPATGRGLLEALLLATLFQNAGRSGGWHGGGLGGGRSGGGRPGGGFGGFSGFGGGRGFGGGGASGGW
jgi:uncharacterized protein